jgi:nucleoside-diphosphate kinase
LPDRTLVLIKPDGVRRGLIGTVISKLEARGLEIVALDLRTLDRDIATLHYAEHEGKPFFPPLIDFITSGPLIAMIAEGHGAIEAFRSLAGPTDPLTAPPGTIRGDHALLVKENVVHGSDSPESATREIKIFFPEFA